MRVWLEKIKQQKIWLNDEIENKNKIQQKGKEKK